MMRTACAAVLLAATAVTAGAGEVTVGGYVDVGWYDIGGGGTAAASNVADFAPSDPAFTAVGSTNGAQTRQGQQSFGVNEVNLYVQAELLDRVTAYASVDGIPTGGRGDASANGGVWTLGNAYLDFARPFDYPFTVRTGLQSCGFGLETCEVESNQKRSVSLSLLSPYATGGSLGVSAFGERGRLAYQIGYGNFDPFGAGAALTSATAATGAANVPTVMANMRPTNNAGVNVGVDNDNHRTVQGRLVWRLLEGLSAGVSGSIGKFAAPLATGDQERRMIGADASWAWGPWSLKGEYLTLDEDNASNGGADASQLRGWYVEGGYAFGAVAALGIPGGLVARYGRSEVEADEDMGPGDADADGYGGTQEIADVAQAVFGGWLDLSDAVRLKAEYQRNDESLLAPVGEARSAGESGNDAFAASIVATF